MGNCFGYQDQSSHGNRLGGHQEVNRADANIQQANLPQERMQTSMADRQRALDAAEERRQVKFNRNRRKNLILI